MPLSSTRVWVECSGESDVAVGRDHGSVIGLEVGTERGAGRKIGRVTEPDAIANARSTYGGKPWHELTDEEHRAMPGDYESQRSQGVFQLHSLESLSTTDQGVTMLRRSLRREIERVAAGEDPAGVTQDPAEAQIAIEGGNFILSVTNRS